MTMELGDIVREAWRNGPEDIDYHRTTIDGSCWTLTLNDTINGPGTAMTIGYDPSNDDFMIWTCYLDSSLEEIDTIGSGTLDDVRAAIAAWIDVHSSGRHW
jgi:hypothetical protein